MACITPIRQPFGCDGQVHNTPPRPVKRCRSSNPRLRLKEISPPFICHDGEWVVAPDVVDPKVSRAKQLSIFTYNVWFIHEFEHLRWSAILRIAERRNPDVLCFQEATPEFIELLMADDWIQTGYVLSHTAITNDVGYAPIMLVRKGLGVKNTFEYELPSSKCDRTLIMAAVFAGGAEVPVATTHLESNKKNRQARLDQLQSIHDEFLAPSAGQSSNTKYDNMIVAGDFNFSDISVEQDELNSQWIDCWREGGDGSEGYTVDTVVNSMFRRYKRDDRVQRVRYDRILIAAPRQSDSSANSRTTSGRFVCDECVILGTDPITTGFADSCTDSESSLPDSGVSDTSASFGEFSASEAAAEEEDAVFPSDHFGLHCTLSFRSDMQPPSTPSIVPATTSSGKMPLATPLCASKATNVETPVTALSGELAGLDFPFLRFDDPSTLRAIDELSSELVAQSTAALKP